MKLQGPLHQILTFVLLHVLSHLCLAAGGVSLEVDPKGYIVFCPCMGRFGNQADHYLGSLEFAKSVDRTLILPPWVEYPYRAAKSDQIPFSTYFRVDAIAEYHRVIPMETFMKELAPTIWPKGERVEKSMQSWQFANVMTGDMLTQPHLRGLEFILGFCYRKDGETGACRMKEGNPFGPFWDKFNIHFDRSEEYGHLTMKTQSPGFKESWLNSFPPSEYPVLAFAGAPASFPVEEQNVGLQEYFQWSRKIEQEADDFIIKELSEGPYVGIHLRHGLDWNNVCGHVDGKNHLFASPQCLGYNFEYGKVTEELCAPPRDVMKKQLKKIVKKIKAKAVFVATDSDALIEELQKAVKVKVVHRTPPEPHIDLAILGKSDHYIGNCVSSFSSFATREREVNGKPTSFWAFKRKGGKEEL